MIHFIWPWLLLLIPLPFFRLFRPQQQSVPVQAPRMPLYERVQRLHLHGIEASHKSNLLVKFFLLTAWIALILAAARPQWMGDKVEISLSGRDLMLAVDISPSMKIQDMVLRGYRATRLAAVKSVVNDFIKQRKGDRVGLILFGTRAYIQAPLTFDTKTVNKLLGEAQAGMAGNSTSIGDAIMMAVKRLRHRPQKSRVLILLTDGANTSGEISPEKAADFAAKEKIKIYTIGIGADRMVQNSIFGSRIINPSSDLDAKMLKFIAKKTGGKFFRAKNSGQLGLIYEDVNRLEPVKQGSHFYRPTLDLFYWPLAFAIIIYLGLLLIPNRFRGSFRKAKI